MFGYKLVKEKDYKELCKKADFYDYGTRMNLMIKEYDDIIKQLDESTVGPSLTPRDRQGIWEGLLHKYLLD